MEEVPGLLKLPPTNMFLYTVLAALAAFSLVMTE
jgi:hypothetical protein